MDLPTSARAISEALNSREISSTEVLLDAFSRIDQRESSVRAFISTTDRDSLVGQAKKVDNDRARGEEVPPFAGIPIAIKDNIAVSGQRLTAGSRILADYIPPYSATTVEKVQAAGLLIVGKTNMDEFGFGSTTENSAFFPTHNPRSLDRVPGGTSGGSAAAVAAGFVPWALGTDTGGSVRQPAALCGVVGIRPTYGRVSRYGVVAFASSMDQVGPISATVADAASLLEIIQGRDPRDSTTLPDGFINDRPNPSGLRIGVPKEYTNAETQREIIQAVDDVVAISSGLGWDTLTVSLPHTEYALSAYYIISSVEAASNLARYDGVKYGYADPGADSWEDLVMRSRTFGFGAEAKRRIILGTYASSVGYEDQFYNMACVTREIVREDFYRVFEDVDVLLSPVSPTTAWKIGERQDDPMKMYLSDVFSVPAALAGVPAVVIEVGSDSEGMPIGLQLTGAPGSEQLLISTARRLEGAIGNSDKR